MLEMQNSNLYYYKPPEGVWLYDMKVKCGAILYFKNAQFMNRA